MSDNTLNIPSTATDEISVVLNSTNELPNKLEAGVSLSTATNLTKINNLMGNIEIVVVSKLHLEKYLSFIDDPNIKQIVIMLTNDSGAVKDIVNMIGLILADGKIDMSDAPLLMGLVKKIVSFRTKDLNISKDLKLSNYLDIMKLVLTILAKEDVLKIANTDEFIADIAKVIDLLKTGEQIAESMSCFPMCMSWLSPKK